MASDDFDGPEILYRKPVVVVDNSALMSPSPESFPSVIPAKESQRSHMRVVLPPLLGTSDTPPGPIENSVWQWLIRTSTMDTPTTMGAMSAGAKQLVPIDRGLTHLEPKTVATELPSNLPRGAPALPSRPPRRQQTKRPVREVVEEMLRGYEVPAVAEDDPPEKPTFTLRDFMVNLESVEKVPKQVLEKAVLSKNNYKTLIKNLSERIAQEANSKHNMQAQGEGLANVNMADAILHGLSEVIINHVRNVELNDESIEVPESFLRMKANQAKRRENLAKKYGTRYGPKPLDVNYQQQLAVYGQARRVGRQPLPSAVSTLIPGISKAGTYLSAEGNLIEYEERPDDSSSRPTSSGRPSSGANDTLQFYTQPTHFQDSVRSKEPFQLVNRDDEVTPTEFAVLESLFSGGRWLSLKAHFISEVPNLVLLHRTLTYMNLSFNCFTEIPNEVYEMECLQILKMRNNPITEIPHAFVRLRRLRVLVLSFCLIERISFGFWYAMERLILLDLSYNKLTSLPNEIMYLKSLKELNVAGNGLVGMPAGALYLNLRRLSVANNFMHSLFWVDNSKNSPQRLQDMAAHRLVKHKLVDSYPDLPEQVLTFLRTGHTPCDACHGPRFGPGLRVIRPCESIFGIKSLPFAFNCCSAECVYIFRRGVMDPVELRSESGDGSTTAITPHRSPGQSRRVTPRAEGTTSPKSVLIAAAFGLRGPGADSKPSTASAIPEEDDLKAVDLDDAAIAKSTIQKTDIEIMLTGSDRAKTQPGVIDLASNRDGPQSAKN